MNEKRVFDLEYQFVDFWGKPIYKVVDKNIYFCSIDTLLPNVTLFPNCTAEEINAYFREHQDQIVLLGSDPDQDPDGRKAANWEYNFIK